MSSETILDSCKIKNFSMKLTVKNTSKRRTWKVRGSFIKVLLTYIIVLCISCSDQQEIDLPSVAISEVTNLMSSSASSGGNVTSDGGEEVIARGVCWSQTQNPTINDPKTIDGSGLGIFSSEIKGLKPNTAYYLRAYAINSNGTGYSNQKSFNTLNQFEILDIRSVNTKVVIGQRNYFHAILSDTIGNINYEWKILYNNVQVGQTISGYNLNSIKLNTKEPGEYRILLTVIRGVSEKSSFEKKFNSVEANFQYGCWGDNEATIKNAEIDNGNTLFQGLVGVPSVIPGNQNLTKLTYKKNNGNYYTYYFSDGKLYAGAYTSMWNYVNINTDLRSAYLLFYSEKLNLESILNISLTEGKIWRITDPGQIAAWDANVLTRSQAIGLNYLELKTEGSSSLGRCSLRLYKPLSQYVGFEYILVSPN